MPTGYRSSFWLLVAVSLLLTDHALAATPTPPTVPLPLEKACSGRPFDEDQEPAPPETFEKKLPIVWDAGRMFLGSTRHMYVLGEGRWVDSLSVVDAASGESISSYKTHRYDRPRLQGGLLVGDRISKDQGPEHDLDVVDLKSGELLWTFHHAGGQEMSGDVTDRSVFVPLTEYLPDASGQRTRALAAVVEFDRLDGSIRRTYPVPLQQRDQYYVPVLDVRVMDGVLLISSQEEGLKAYDVKTGKELWRAEKKRLEFAFNRYVAVMQVYSGPRDRSMELRDLHTGQIVLFLPWSPIQVSGDQVFIGSTSHCPGTPQNDWRIFAAAVSLKTGEVLWARTAHAPDGFDRVRSVLLTSTDLLLSEEASLWALNRKTGAVSWHLDGARALDTFEWHGGTRVLAYFDGHPTLFAPIQGRLPAEEHAIIEGTIVPHRVNGRQLESEEMEIRIGRVTKRVTAPGTFRLEVHGRGQLKVDVRGFPPAGSGIVCSWIQGAVAPPFRFQGLGHYQLDFPVSDGAVVR